MDRMPPPYARTTSETSASTSTSAAVPKPQAESKHRNATPPVTSGLSVQTLSSAETPAATPSFAKTHPLSIPHPGDIVSPGGKRASPLSSGGVMQSLRLLESLPREASQPWDKVGRQCVGLLKMMLEAHQPMVGSRSSDILTTFQHDIAALRMQVSAQLDQLEAGCSVTRSGRWMQAAPAGHEAAWKAVKVASMQLRVTLSQLSDQVALLDQRAHAATSAAALAAHPDVIQHLPTIETLVSEDLVEFGRDLSRHLASLPRDLFETDSKSSE